MIKTAKICASCGELVVSEANKCISCGGELLDTGENWRNFALPNCTIEESNRKQLYYINTLCIPYGKFDKAKFDMVKAMEERNSQQSVKEESNIPHCPTCNSTDLKKISGLGTMAKIGMFGIFGAGNLGKTWKCRNCGSKW